MVSFTKILTFSIIFATSFIVSCDSNSNSSFIDCKNIECNSEYSKIASIFDTIIVQNIGDLPKCNSSRNSRSFFVKSENAPYFCINNNWVNNDNANLNVTCNDGFLYATITEPDLQNNAKEKIQGIVQKGPFIFGSSIVAQIIDSQNLTENINYNEAQSNCIILNDGSYDLQLNINDTSLIKITATGFFNDEILGNISTNKISLSAVSNKPKNINVITHLSIPRISQLVASNIPFDKAQAQAEREVFAAFGIDTTLLYLQCNAQNNNQNLQMLAKDINVFSSSECAAAMFAISTMLLSLGSNELSNLLNNLGEDLKGDGVWNDNNWKIKIADLVVELDSSWKYNDIRNNAYAFGATTVPNFEKYMRNFFAMAYNFEPCNEFNANTVTFVNNGQSEYFANNYEHATHSTTRFICDANAHEWRVASAIEKDTAGFGVGLYDKEIREGKVNYGSYYIYETATNLWRTASAQEADGFTDIDDIYANLSANEKIIFIIRHSERTDDTSIKGHLTENGKRFAFELGARLKGEDFYYGYSGFTRTKETCENIAQGKGQKDYILNELDFMSGDFFVKDLQKLESYKNSNGGGWIVFSKYAFESDFSDAFYDLKERSKELINNKILKNLPNMKRINILCTHDQLLVPLLAYVTNGHANVRYYATQKWLNYLAGVAIIISADNKIRYEPIKGLETGIM